jgi:hypothetical protein
MLVFTSNNRPGGFGETDLWMTTRASIEDEWSSPKPLPKLINSPLDEGAATLSLDGSILYFASRRPGGFGGWDQWQAPILPIVDFNGDGLTDLIDLQMLIDNWETAEKLFDIGPMPWGDGIVDVEDLKVFIEQWEKQ